MNDLQTTAQRTLAEHSYEVLVAHNGQKAHDVMPPHARSDSRSSPINAASTGAAATQARSHNAPGAWRRKTFMNSPNMCRRLRRLRRKLSLAGLVRYRVCNLRRKKKLMADETCCHPRVPLKPLEIDTLGKVAVSMVILVIVASVVAQIAVLRLSNKPG